VVRNIAYFHVRRCTERGGEMALVNLVTNDTSENAINTAEEGGVEDIPHQQSILIRLLWVWVVQRRPPHLIPIAYDGIHGLEHSFSVVVTDLSQLSAVFVRHSHHSGFCRRQPRYRFAFP